MQPEILHDAHATLGEGPAWDAKTRTLYWVDILEKRVYFHREDENGFIQLTIIPGCLAPCKDGNLLLAASASILTLAPATSKTIVLVSVDEPDTNRFNDGKCDPAGRFLAGTMDMDESAASGALYSYDGLNVIRLLEGIRISNGLAWSPDFSTMYYIDTPTREVKAFDYDLATGRIGEMRVAIQIPPALGWPDGMTSDLHGNLWIAMWGGALVTHWDPRSGRLLEQIPMPAKNVTSVVFGGTEMDELYVTTARVGMNSTDLASFIHSGSLMRIKTGIMGMPTFEFG